MKLGRLFEKIIDELLHKVIDYGDQKKRWKS